MKASSESLEYHLIQQETAAYALSPEGADAVYVQEPFSDREAVIRELRITAQCADLLAAQHPAGISSFPHISEPLKQLHTSGSVLESEQLAAVGWYLRQSQALALWITEAPQGYDRTMPETGCELPGEVPGLAAETLKHFDASGNIREDHPRLLPLYRALEQSRRERGEVASKLLQHNQDIWQELSPTIREGRVVLPIKSVHKARVPGLVHGMSATGNTVFIEPQKLADSNNQVVIQEQKIQAEYYQILKDVTNYIRSHIDVIEQTRAVIRRWDFLYAKARFAVIRQCSAPEITRRLVYLEEARHPLLGADAVPITMEIPEDKLAVIMTGPNAGGKTVSAKTLGLLAMMTAHGMLIPAGSSSRIPLFSSIEADIGDDQSIAESLSTFSGHMKKISRIIAQIDSRSLVIFDELASGTDTYEGAALAKSIIEYCLEMGCLTLVTSHHMSLKQFGYTDSRVLNAAMEFDDQKKAPTYRVLIGSPGNSYAIETAERMGLPERVVASAREYLQESSDRTTSMIRRLEEQELELHQQQERLEAYRKELAEQQRTQDLRALQLRQQEVTIRKKDASFVRSFIESSRKELENLVRLLREGELTKEKLKQVKEFQQELERKEQAFTEQLQQEEQKLSSSRGYQFSEGMQVYAGKTQREGTILRRSRKQGFWLVEMGNLRMDISENDLTPIEQQKNPRYDAPNRRVEVSYEKQGGRPRFEIDVRGEVLDAALNELEQQIDRALVYGVVRFSIIHGKGEGILQRGIQDYLSRHASVAGFSFASPEEGGYGKTIVELQS